MMMDSLRDDKRFQLHITGRGTQIMWKTNIIQNENNARKQIAMIK
jgi:hypothetical protein